VDGEKEAANVTPAFPSSPYSGHTFDFTGYLAIWPLNPILNWREADVKCMALTSASNSTPKRGDVFQLQRRSNMTARTFVIAPAMVMALGAATALAQPAAHPLARFGQVRLIDHGALLWSYDQAGAIVAHAAFVSDGCSPSYLPDQQGLAREPGYSIGTGAAELCHAPATVSDGSNPSYLRDQQELVREPGYSVGTGTARVSAAW
jgi:hypothetical protein